MTLCGPCLDDLADGVPCRIDGALGDAAAKGSLLDNLVLVKGVVQLGHHHVAVATCKGANLLQLLICFNFQHNLMFVSWPPPCSPFGGVLSLGTVVHN